MTKLAIAAIALGLAGAGALAAVGATRISNGQCPLTGRQIHCHAAPLAAQSSPALAADAVAAPQTDVAADAAECPVSHATQTESSGHSACPGRHCVPDCAENPPPQCEEKRCPSEKKAPAENP